MHEILNSFKQNPSQNFNKYSLILKNPKIFQNPKNLGFKTWNACKGISIDWEVSRIYQEEANLDGSRSYRGDINFLNQST